MLAIVHKMAEPWQMPQRKELRHVPKGVEVRMDREERDSAIHSV